jgi:hypothetical protein
MDTAIHADASRAAGRPPSRMARMGFKSPV